VVGGDADRLADRRDAPRPGAGGASVRQCGFRVDIKKFAGRDQMPRHDVGRRAIQSG
jgi:hypothetical protein